jgi:hypothetical protein
VNEGNFGFCFEEAMWCFRDNPHQDAVFLYDILHGEDLEALYRELQEVREAKMTKARADLRVIKFESAERLFLSLAEADDARACYVLGQW